MSDSIYQQRYLNHQARKKEQITKSIGEDVFFEVMPDVMTVLDRRRSQRLYTNEQISSNELDVILKAATMSPNSCNRHGVLLKIVSDRREKELLGGLLVGGVGWVHRAHTIILFLADPVAYASPNERDFMHYCDVGFKAMSMWLAAESINIGACYINPNLVDESIFKLRFSGGDLIFCGALALGHFDKRPAQAERPSIKEILV